MTKLTTTTMIISIPERRTNKLRNNGTSNKNPRPLMSTAKGAHERASRNGSRPLVGTSTTNDEGTISKLQVLARRDQYAIRDKLRIERSLSCFVNQFMSPPGLPKKEFQKAMKKSDTYVKLYRDTGDPGELPVEILGDISDSFQCLDVLAKRQKEMQKQIETNAQELPAYLWWEKQMGLGAKGLGLIVGHAGNIGTFRKAAGLWQRMGLRNVKFHACSTFAAEKLRHTAGLDRLTKEEWVNIGYAPKRRSVMFAIVDSMLRHQRKSKNKDTSLSPSERWVTAGVYGQLAIDRYTQSLKEHKDWTPLHRERDINRIVGKKLLSDLLKVWKS